MLGDLLLVNGRIATMDRARPWATAVAVRQGRVVAVGDDAAVRAAGGPGLETIDLRGRAATPGLNDAHAHPMIVGFALGDLSLSTPPHQSVADLVAVVGDATRHRTAGEWIIGRGYDHARLADRRHPTRHDLDPVAPAHPVLLIRMCHHIGVANSAALAWAGITRETPDPPGGIFDRDETGELTGVLREAALEQVRAAIAPPTQAQIEAALTRSGAAFLANGVTSVAEAGIDDPLELRAYQALRQRDELPVRTYLMMMLDENLDALAALGIRTGFGDDWLKIGPVKLFSDGSLGGRTARLRQPYAGQPDNLGLWMMPPAELKEKVARAHAAGFQVAIHAIGDGAIKLVVEAYTEAMHAAPRPDPRHRIEHCSIVDDALLDRIAAIGAVPVPGTSFLYHFRDAYLDALGPDRPAQAYGIASYLRHGLIAAASSDAPVVPIAPLIGLQTMVTRHDLAGEPVWPAEAVSLEEALRVYTVNGAYASFEEDHKGTLAPGMLGDITVYGADIFALPPAELGTVPIDHTIVGGVVAYSRA